jgi:hypothetical protein
MAVAAPRVETAKPRVANVRTAKNATQKRRAHAVRSRYATIWRFSAALALGLILVMTYLMLTANVTSLNYAVARAERERAGLQSETMRLDDRLAQLRSDSRLARVAAKLNMRDPQQFALVKMPVQRLHNDDRHIALLSAISGWFGAK